MIILHNYVHFVRAHGGRDSKTDKEGFGSQDSGIGKAFGREEPIKKEGTVVLVYNRNGIWYLLYCKGSKLIRNNQVGLKSKREAKEQLALEEVNILKGGTQAHMLKCTLAELLQDLVVEYENNHKEVREV